MDASKAIMARLSGHGVKLVLPDLLKGLEDDSWRTKAGTPQRVGHSRRGWGRGGTQQEGVGQGGG